MSEGNKVSRKLGKITKIEMSVQVKGAKAVYIEYTQPDSDNPARTFKGNIFHNFLKDHPSVGAHIKALKVGDEVCIVREQQEGWWNIIDITDKADVPPQRPAFGGGGGFKKGGGSNFNAHGAKVGGIIHDAVAMAVAIHTDKVTVDHVDALARDLLGLSFTLEKECDEGAFKDIQKKEVVKKEPVKVSKPDPKTMDEKVNAAIEELTELDDFEF